MLYRFCPKIDKSSKFLSDYVWWTSDFGFGLIRYGLIPVCNTMLYTLYTYTFWFICSYWFFNYWSIIDFFPNQLWRPWNFGFRLITYGFPYVCNTNMYSRKLSFWDIDHLFLHGWQPSWTPSWISQNAQGCPWVHPVDSERVGPGLPKSIKKTLHNFSRFSQNDNVWRPWKRCGTFDLRRRQRQAVALVTRE